MRAAGAELWATDLAPGAQALTAPVMARLAAAFPRRVALVLGAESVGISEEVRAAAAVRLYLPIHGFSDSLNVSVAAALVLQRLFDVRAARVRRLTPRADVPLGARRPQR